MYALISEARFASDYPEGLDGSTAAEGTADDLRRAAIELHEEWLTAGNRARALGGGIYIVGIPLPGERIDVWFEEA